ncbi:MAG: DNA polymerase III subunit gamma/tau [Clostridia bacterium]|nr:DNA polymerase III subunit gamma/tau [Clostridia bacterium]
MAYSALYRKFRPERFGQIIGQPHITTILLNQIRSGRVAHAYLFCGSRGTGKTSTARILAKAINCLSPENGEPCGKCEACLSENNVDIIEMDAASNSRVEEMRALIERAEFAPLHLKTKVYIIDEAHMLTKNASNALLKTLEEPPAHVVFILATTEPQMLPATIVSRCQRFEFHRLSVSDMVGSMKRSLSSIGAHIEDEGLIAIARAAEGGMRDCLSIADQCLSFCGDNVSADDVMSVLGSVNTGFLFKMADAVIASDAAQVMRLVGDVVTSGRDLGVFALDMASHFRALLLTKICGDCRDILDCTGEMMRDYREQAARISKERAERAVEELLKLQLDLKLVTTPRALVESTMLRIIRPQDEASFIAMSDRLNELENKLKNVSAEAIKAASAAQRQPEPIRDEQPEPAPQKPVKQEAPSPGLVSVPDATPDGDELYSRLHEALMDADQTLYFAIETSQAHWVEDGVLHICFDGLSANMYEYANMASMRQIINDTARKTIAPVTVELELRKYGVIKQNTVTELFGVPIETE